jgi:hypothetical protein
MALNPRLCGCGCGVTPRSLRSSFLPGHHMRVPAQGEAREERPAPISQVCGCGCGGTRRSTQSAFLPGHHMRVAPRGEGRGALAVLVRPLCKCGCGETVPTPGARYISDHWRRTEDARSWRGRGQCECGCGEAVRTQGARFAAGHWGRTAEGKAQRLRARWRTCPECSRRQLVPPNRDATWRACSRACISAGRRHPAWNALQRHCLEWMAEHGMNLSAFAQEAGVRYLALRRWFVIPQSTLRQEKLLALAETLGISPEQAKADAGGLSAEDRASAFGHALGARMASILNSPEHRGKGGRAHRGRPKPPDFGAKLRIAQLGHPDYAQRMARLAAMTKAPERRALHSLVMRLRAAPAPSRDDLTNWAEPVAERLNLPRQAVLAVWRPHLQKRGLLGKGGRPIQTNRCEIAAEEWLISPPKQGQRGPDAYWHRVARRVSEAEGVDPPLDRQDMQKWESKHPPHPDCPLATAKGRTPLSPSRNSPQHE